MTKDGRGRVGEYSNALKEMESNEEPSTGGKPAYIELPSGPNLLVIASLTRITSPYAI